MKGSTAKFPEVGVATGCKRKAPGAVARSAALAALLAIAAVPSLAQRPAAAAKDYPAKPVRVIIPYAPGGGVDVVGYAIQQKLAAALGQNVLFDNRPGAGGVLGTDIVAKSAPDGYTVLLTSGSFTTTPYFFKKLPIDLTDENRYHL